MFACAESGVEYDVVQAMDVNTTANKIYQHNFPDVSICASTIAVSHNLYYKFLWLKLYICMMIIYAFSFNTFIDMESLSFNQLRLSKSSFWGMVVDLLETESSIV